MRCPDSGLHACEQAIRAEAVPGVVNHRAHISQDIVQRERESIGLRGSARLRVTFACCVELSQFKTVKRYLRER
jgi:hypothetical protein